LLAPFGLNAQLTGHSIPDSDAKATKIMNEWKRFFPVEGQAKETIKADDTLPKMVEIMLGDVKMLYPSALILVACSPPKGIIYRPNFYSGAIFYFLNLLSAKTF